MKWKSVSKIHRQTFQQDLTKKFSQCSKLYKEKNRERGYRDSKRNSIYTMFKLQHPVSLQHVKANTEEAKAKAEPALAHGEAQA